MAKISAKQSIARLVKICKAKDLRHVVISPGSRNAALTLSFAEEPFFDCLNIPDERVAAFFALGMAQRLGKPVILICTSGTAGLNYAPAIAEAYYQKVPLLILTADRPIEWVDQRAGQTMKQRDMYANYIKKSFELFEEPKQQEHLWFNDRIVNEAINLASSGSKGPVHINVPMREPLYDMIEASEVVEPKVIKYREPDRSINGTYVNELKEEWYKANRVLVIVGQKEVNKNFDKVIETIAELPHVVVLTETTSNVNAPFVFPSIDRVIDSIAEEEYELFAPDLIISCGASIVSKKIRFMLRQMPVAQHWHVDPFDSYIDTYQALTRMVPVHPDYLFDLLLSFDSKDGDQAYKDRWKLREKYTLSKHDEYLYQVGWSDLKVLEILMTEIPSGILQVASSTPVRYSQLFPPRTDLRYKCNRGISGIDGCTSTAAGYAYITEEIVTLITGDLAFFYDSNALWHHHLSDNLKIIMINNEGGNIFRYVNGPNKTSHLEKHFEASHLTKARGLADTHGIDYYEAKDEQSLRAGLEALFDSTHTALLEVHTPREANIPILKEYFRYLNPNLKSD